jgi:hypothetical protein
MTVSNTSVTAQLPSVQTYPVSATPKVLLLLQMMDAAGGPISASDHGPCLLNYFCDDTETGSDTFNQAIDAGYVRTEFNSMFESSTAYLTNKGREAIAAARSFEFAQKQQEPIAWVKDLLDLYFAPWGAAKAARFEAMTGDKPFDGEVVLKLIHEKLTTSDSSTVLKSEGSK